MVAQQCLRRIEKKSPRLTNDPNFSNQWYLVSIGVLATLQK